MLKNAPFWVVLFVCMLTAMDTEIVSGSISPSTYIGRLQYFFTNETQYHTSARAQSMNLTIRRLLSQAARPPPCSVSLLINTNKQRVTPVGNYLDAAPLCTNAHKPCISAGSYAVALHCILRPNAVCVALSLSLSLLCCFWRKIAHV